MKRAANIFFAAGVVALLVEAAYRCKLLRPPAHWVDGSLVIELLTLHLGLVASLLAALFASIMARHAKTNELPRLLLCLSGSLLLVFVIFLFLYA
jgi:hypothetical protein